MFAAVSLAFLKNKLKTFAKNKYFNNLLATNEVQLPPLKLSLSHVAIIAVMYASIKNLVAW